MIRVNNQWKVSALDDETVKIMSANFKSVEDEIRQTLDSLLKRQRQKGKAMLSQLLAQMVPLLLPTSVSSSLYPKCTFY
ncbi:MAG: hypothetical protein V8Q57_06875 [Blautia sp.]